jgi:hypothetical protein
MFFLVAFRRSDFRSSDPFPLKSSHSDERAENNMPRNQIKATNNGIFMRRKVLLRAG